jgi:DNA-binding CsgD family transcriptional regulator
VIEFVRRRRYTPLWAWCRTTFAGILISTGEWRRAEDELQAALRTYGETHREHRIYALVRLAELRLRQGRLEEADRLLEGCEDQPLALQPRVTLALLRGEIALAEGLVARRVAAVGVDSPSGMQLAPLLGEVRLASGDIAGAEDLALRLRARALETRRENLVGLAELLLGRIGAARGDGDAATRLEAAAELFGHLGMPLEKGRARLELAQVFAPASPELAVEEARAACREFERLGAQLDADRAASVLRSFGVSGRTAARGDAALTRREEDVLALLGLGLTNAEIAERLFIARKTAEHHVGRVLRKLGLHTRAEAAAFAVRRESDAK